MKTGPLAEPFGDVTETTPVVALPGTLTLIEFDVAELILAAIPLKVTVSWLGFVLNPLPKIVTLEPPEPLSGERESTVTPEGWEFVTSVTLPSES